MWYFIAGRYDDSLAGEELKIWLNADTEIAAATYNSIFPSAADFVIGGAHGGTNLLTGCTSHCWICAAALSDEHVQAVFQQQRSLFGV